MRSVFIIFVLSAFCFIDVAEEQEIDTTSYSVGLSLGYRLKNQGASQLDYPSVIKAIQDVLEGNEMLITKAYSDSLNYIYYQNKRDNMFADAKKEGADFLVKNGERM